ncbi:MULTISPECIES: DUF1289 domain-containing protein [Hyphomonas]|jgi:predicted Fe-S protein YdhL (DUF1289 family)|uniref:Fe-S protein n=1 Tax=Hyphomonas jannaschiana VP2 TaxID=1280952 RepID=A0A059F7D3_9PROT|nr:DUF1289 domain-containing protein [Hyphomonas jannaschiana]KCZ86445.1 hypothetical protein HJA_15774 [Hyphomonas jannaschiana VP2]
MSREPIKSPCIKVCAVDASTGWCLGCGRTLKEIGQWVAMGEPGRERVLCELPERIGKLEALGKR